MNNLIQQITFSNFETYEEKINSALQSLETNNVISRIWDHDYKVWADEPTEIVNRLGWLDIAKTIGPSLERINEVKTKVIKDGFTNVLLLGMGGSSLAPQVFSKIFGVKNKALDLDVLDSTHPKAVLTYQSNLDLEKTLFIVATKSGGTVETLSFFKYFYNQVEDVVGTSKVGNHFIAITDPGSKLEKIAQEYNFRELFLNNPNIGGRFSALSFFGLVPAALIGVDINLLLKRAKRMMSDSEPGKLLGTVLGTLANEGRDKLTFIPTDNIESFVDWVEQLIAESTGKAGKGILPVVREPWRDGGDYSDDRLFISLSLDHADQNSEHLNTIKNNGHPIVHIHLDDLYDLGGQFFLWEFSTAVAGHFLYINTFNQPNVESAKVLAREMVSKFEQDGKLPEGQTSKLSHQSLENFLKDSNPGDYICIQAYLQPTAEIFSALQRFRQKLLNHFNLATTLGYGPRYLHSTGQLHKGDKGNGWFIQLIADITEDTSIPDIAGKNQSSMTFGKLITAQALGDGQALVNANRHLIRFNLGDDVIGGLKTLGG